MDDICGFCGQPFSEEPKGYCRHDFEHTEYQLRQRIAELEAEKKELIRQVTELDAERRSLWVIISSQDTPRWIPCSERLPEDGERVLICINGTYISGFHNARVPVWSLDNGKYYGGDFYRLVEYWMPMPEPPEEEE